MNRYAPAIRLKRLNVLCATTSMGHPTSIPLLGSITDPRIVIFDEATSALDYESERIIQEHMTEIARRRTVFIIAHRLSTVRRTDRILTVDRGRLVEDGTHDELVRTGGRYAALFRLQAGIHEVH